MATKYYKVLGEGFKTRNGFDWIPALDFKTWIEEKDCETSTNPCGKGIHVWKNYPRYTIFPYIPDHTFEVEIDSSVILGQDQEKIRIRKIKLIRLLEKKEIFKSNANLRSANLRSADLRSADLRSANLQSANLQSANLQGADLRSANLQGADLQGADLWSANLQGANLWSANLQGADLQGADLWSANLQGANLQGADLQDAHGVKHLGEIAKDAHC